MRNAPTMLAIWTAGVVVSSCQAPVQTFERTFFDPTKHYIGMTKEQVVACAGKPSGSYGTTSGETLTRTSAALLAAGKSMDIEVNPRYGRWNPRRGVSPLVSGGLSQTAAQLNAGG